MIDKKDTQLFLDDYAGFLRNSIVYVASLLRKYFLSIFVITALCAGAGFACWYSMKPCYEASMVCGYNNARLSRKNYGEMFEKLDVLAKSGSYNELSKLLQLPVAQAALLTGFEAKNMGGSPLQDDVSGNYQSLYFTVRANDKDVFGPLQPALINYLSNGPYQREIGVIEVAKIGHQVAFLQQDINQLDSVVAAYTVFLKNTGKADSVLGFADITGLLAYKNQLQEKLVSLESKKAMEAAVSVLVIHGFTPGDKPARGSKRVIFSGLLIGLLIGFCQALWREAKRGF